MRQRRKREKPREAPDKHVINEHITASQIRLIGEKGEQHGVVSIGQARTMADEANLDLVQVSADSDPPVVKMLDYGKVKYREQKKAAEARKRTSTHVVKELRVRYSTDTHDLETKLRKARGFLSGGDRVRFQMRFRGREVQYKDLGEDIFKKIAAQLEDIAGVEEFTPLMGNRMTMILVPLSQQSGARTKEDSKEES